MYSGSLIRTVFNGTSVEVILKDDSLRNMFTVLIDDSIFVLTTNKPDGIYLLASNLEDRNHLLKFTAGLNGMEATLFLKALTLTEAKDCISLQ